MHYNLKCNVYPIHSLSTACSGVRRPELQKGGTHLSFQSRLFQLLWNDSMCFQTSWVSPACSGSFPGSFPSGACLKHLLRKTTRSSMSVSQQCCSLEPDLGKGIIISWDEYMFHFSVFQCLELFEELFSPLTDNILKYFCRLLYRSLVIGKLIYNHIINMLSYISCIAKTLHVFFCSLMRKAVSGDNCASVLRSLCLLQIEERENTFFILK